MKVQVISDTVQKFDGVSYYKCGHYFQRKGVRLHRKVWEYHHGPIPDGFHVHHKDENRSHNDDENLELLEGSEHLSHHMNKPERKAKSHEDVKKAIEAAPAWHHSKAGEKWHSERGKENWKVRTTQTYRCSYCGKEFQTKHIYGAGMNHFCHPNCRAAFRRMRIKNGEIDK